MRVSTGPQVKPEDDELDWIVARPAIHFSPMTQVVAIW
jgi:hypothetical protein